MSDPDSGNVLQIPDWYDEVFDPYCLMVGRISILWAGFENDLDQLIAELANVEAAAGVCLTGQMIGPGPRFRALIALIRFRELDEKDVASWNALAEKAGGLAGQRNRYIHDNVVVGLDSGVVSQHVITADRRAKHELVPFDLAKAHKLWLDIKNAQNRLHELRIQLKSSLPHWPIDQFLKSRYGIRRFSTREEAESSLGQHTKRFDPLSSHDI